MHTNDTWFALEQNWDHFFWLTGEIPSTLSEVVENIDNILQRRTNGRQCVLSLRNQVFFE